MEVDSNETVTVLPPELFLAFVAMSTTISPESAAEYTSRFRVFSGRYDVEAHLRWLLNVHEFRTRLEQLGEVGANPRRRAGLAWREYGIDDVRGDLAAIERWRGEHRRLGEVLPPKLRPFVPLLARNVNAPVDVSSSRGLPPGDVGRMHRVCRQKLKLNSEPLTGADRSFLFRRLRILDPIGEPWLRIEAPMGLEAGDLVALNATSAAVGSWVPHHVTPGYPAVGTLVEDAEGRFTVRPSPVPKPRGET